MQLAQELARMFNRRYGTTFPIPQSIIVSNCQASKLRSLRNPNKKMSKSDPDPKSIICMTDSPDQIVSKIKKAVTDFTSEITYSLEERPGVSNLINILSILSGKSVEKVCEEAQGLDTLQYVGSIKPFTMIYCFFFFLTDSK